MSISVPIYVDSVNRKAVGPSSNLKPLLAHALAVAVKKLAAGSRDSLEPGAYEVSENVRIVGTLTVGHDSETAATHTPDADLLLGLVLAKLNAVTRQSILRDVAADFAAAGNEYPQVPAEIVVQTEALTAGLRRTVKQKRRGAVSGQFAIANLGNVIPTLSTQPLGIAG